MATPIGRLAAALGNDAMGLSADGLVDLVIEKLGLTMPGEADAAEGTAEVESAEAAEEQDVTEEEAAAARMAENPPVS